jgi:hypothetical protein
VQIEVNELQAAIHRGARVAYNLDNPFVSSSSFEDWLRTSVTATRANGRSEIIGHLELLCGRAVLGESRVPLKDQGAEDQRAVCVAYAALQGLNELEEMARLAAIQEAS